MEGKPKINDDSYMLLDNLVSKGIKDKDTQSPYVNISLSYLREGMKLLNLGLQIKDQKSRQRFNRIKDAQDCFKKSLDEVTSAFKNNSVRTKDRFMAEKLLVAATILKSRSVEDPEAAVTDCLLKLEKLRNLQSAIEEYISGFRKYITFPREITFLVYHDSSDSMISNESANHRTWPSVKKRPYVPSNQIFVHE